MFYLYNPSVTLRPLWFDGEFGINSNLYLELRYTINLSQTIAGSLISKAYRNLRNMSLLVTGCFLFLHNKAVEMLDETVLIHLKTAQVL